MPYLIAFVTAFYLCSLYYWNAFERIRLHPFNTYLIILLHVCCFLYLVAASIVLKHFHIFVPGRSTCRMAMLLYLLTGFSVYPLASRKALNKYTRLYFKSFSLPPAMGVWSLLTWFGIASLIILYPVLIGADSQLYHKDGTLRIDCSRLNPLHDAVLTMYRNTLFYEKELGSAPLPPTGRIHTILTEQTADSIKWHIYIKSTDNHTDIITVSDAR